MEIEHCVHYEPNPARGGGNPSPGGVYGRPRRAGVKRTNSNPQLGLAMRLTDPGVSARAASRLAGRNLAVI